MVILGLVKESLVIQEPFQMNSATSIVVLQASDQHPRHQVERPLTDDVAMVKACTRYMYTLHVKYAPLMR